jgi:sugar lactone lactonase YvrE
MPAGSRTKNRSIRSNIFNNVLFFKNCRQGDALTISGMYLVGRNYVRGVLTIILLVALVQGISGDESCTFVKTWPFAGGSGTVPPDISLDPSGAVYVTGPENGRVLRYSPEGTLTTYWELNDTESGISVVPAGIVADASRNVYVTDRKNSTILKLTWNKKELWGREGSANGEYDRPAGIAVDSSGTVYVADTGNIRVQKIHSDGTWLLQWGSYGTARGAFNAPGSIAIDAQDHVYVTDAGNSRIQKFTSDGTALTEWGSRGTGAGQFLTPSGVAVDSWGNVYVADLTSRVQKFSPTGEYFTACNTSGTVYDIAINPSGELFVIMQSGSSWEIGVYRFPSPLTRETPEKRSTFAVLVPNSSIITVVPTTAAPVPKTPAEQQTVPAEPFPTRGSEIIPMNTSGPAPVPSAGDAAIQGTYGIQTAEGYRIVLLQPNIFDSIVVFLSSEFGITIPFPM